MSQTEFLILIPGILIALSLAEMIIYVGKTIRYKVKVYWELGLLLFLSLDLLFGNWYAFYQRIQFIHESYGIFLLVNLVPIVFFIYSAVLVPENILDTNISDGKDHYLRNRKMIWALLTAYVFSNYLTVDLLLAQDNMLQIARAVFIPLVGANIFINSKYLRTGVILAAFIVRYGMMLTPGT